MRGWKKRWDAELEGLIPELREDILRTPIPKREHEADSMPRRRGSFWKPRLCIAALAGALACILLVLAILPFLGRLFPSNQPPIEPASNGQMLVTVQINPALTFMTDADGNVTNLISANADADLILSDADFSDQCIGKSLNEATVLFVDRCARLGFLDVREMEGFVKVSALQGEKIEEELAMIRSGVQSYFCENGIYAVVDTEILTEISDYAALNGYHEMPTSVQDLVKGLRKLPAYYTERDLEGLSKEDLQSRYRSAVIGDELKNNLQEILTSNLGKLTGQYTDLLEIVNLNNRIMVHGQNPCLFLKNYWSVLEYCETDTLAPEFAGLMSEMEILLTEYSECYGIEIESFSQLLALSEQALTLPIEKLSNLLDPLSHEDLLENADLLFVALEGIGCDMDQLRSLMKLPESVDAYLEQNARSLQIEAGNRLSQHEEAYLSARDCIARMITMRLQSRSSANTAPFLPTGMPCKKKNNEVMQ